MIPKRSQPPKPFDGKKDEEYVRATWAFQRGFVRFCLIPFPFALLWVAHWMLTAPLSPPPMLAFAVGLGSLGAHMMLSFLYWRCPSCNSILYRTSGAGAAYTFWLGDPDDCPYCGVNLVAVKKPPVKAAPPRPKGDKY